MVARPQQPGLDLQIPLQWNWDNLVHGSSSISIINRLRRNPAADDDYLICLTGPAGAGKSLLARLWAQQWKAYSVQGNAWQQLIEKIKRHSFPASSCLVIDDFTWRAEAQIELWQLLNLIQAEKMRLLLTHQLSPEHWPGLNVPDLRTRLLASVRLHLNFPDDKEICEILDLHMARYGFARSEKNLAVWQYCLLRIPRSYPVLEQLAILMHEEALANHRGLSIPVARRAIARLDQNIDQNIDQAIALDDSGSQIK